MEMCELKEGASPFDVNGADAHMVFIGADGSGVPEAMAKRFPPLARAVKQAATLRKLKVGDVGLWRTGNLWWLLPIVRDTASDEASFITVRRAVETAAAKAINTYALGEVVVWFPDDLCKLKKGRDDLELALSTIEEHTSNVTLWVPRDARVR